MIPVLYINGRFMEEPDADRLTFPWVLLKHWNRLIGKGELGLAPRMMVLTSRKFEGNSPWEYIPVKRAGLFSGDKWEQFDLPRLAKDGLLFSPLGTGPVNHPRQIVRYPDTALFGEPRAFPLVYRVRAQNSEKKLLRQALRVITDTNFYRMKLEKLAEVPAHLLYVLPAGVDQLLQVEAEPLVLDNNRLQPFEYVLASREEAPYCNIELLLEAAASPEMQDIRFAVIDRGSDNPLTTPLTPNVTLVRRIKPVELRALYENAAVFVNLATYGDLPFTALESIACQCPVLSSTSAAFPEVLGASAEYFDPESQEDLGRQIRKSFLRTDQDEMVPVLEAQYHWEIAAPGFYDLIAPFVDPTAPEAWSIQNN